MLLLLATVADTFITVLLCARPCGVYHFVMQKYFVTRINVTDACKIAEMVRIQLKSQSNNLKGINIYPAGYKNMNYTLKKYQKKLRQM